MIVADFYAATTKPFRNGNVAPRHTSRMLSNLAHGCKGLKIGETRSNFLWITRLATYNYGCPILKYPQPAQHRIVCLGAAKNS